MSGEIGTQSKALHAFPALEGLCMGFEMLTSVVLAANARMLTND